MAFIYATENLITIDTLDSVSSEDTLYVKENLYNERPSFPFRFTAKNNQWIKIHFSAATQIKLAALFNHNLQNVSTIRLEANNADAWGAPPYQLNLAWREENLYSKLNQSYSWWRLFVHDPTNPNTLELGEFFLGLWTSFSTGHVHPKKSEGLVFFGSQTETFAGQDWDAYLSRSDRFRILIRNVSNPAVVDSINTFLKDILGSAGRFIIIPDDNYPHVYYVKAMNLENVAEVIVHGTQDVRDWSLELKALTSGVLLL